MPSPHEPDAAEDSPREGNTLPRDSAEDEPAVVPVAEGEAAAAPAPKDNFAVAYLKRLRGAGQKAPPLFVPTWDGVPSFLFTGITLMVLAVIEEFGLQPYDKGLLSYLPSFGASCCLVMYLLTSPGAQPRALIATHVTGAFLGVSFRNATYTLPERLSQLLASAFGVALLTPLMMLTGTFQPSASATTCLAAFHIFGAMNDRGFMFMITPALVGPCVIAFLGWLLNNVIPWRHCYPLWL